MTTKEELFKQILFFKSKGKPPNLFLIYMRLDSFKDDCIRKSECSRNHRQILTKIKRRSQVERQIFGN